MRLMTEEPPLRAWAARLSGWDFKEGRACRGPSGGEAQSAPQCRPRAHLQRLQHQCCAFSAELGPLTSRARKSSGATWPGLFHLQMRKWPSRGTKHSEDQQPRGGPSLPSTPPLVENGSKGAVKPNLER